MVQSNPMADLSGYAISAIALLFGLWLLAQSVGADAFPSTVLLDNSRGAGWATTKTVCSSDDIQKTSGLYRSCAGNVVFAILLTLGGISSVIGGLATLVSGNESYGAKGATVGFGFFLLSIGNLRADLIHVSEICSTDFDFWSEREELTPDDSGFCVSLVFETVFAILGALACWAGALANLAHAAIGHTKTEHELGILVAACVVGFSSFLMVGATTSFFASNLSCGNEALSKVGLKTQSCGGSVSRGLFLLIGALCGPLVCLFTAVKHRGGGGDGADAVAEKLANEQQYEEMLGAPEEESLLV